MRNIHFKTFALGLLLITNSTRAATNILDFNTDPGNTLYEGFSAADDGVPVVLWRPSGGVTGGYLGITDSHNGQRSALVFHDLENGLIVKSFSFECDVRIGGGTHSAADGFSINYCSTNDPVVLAADAGNNPGFLFAGTDGEPAPSALAEEGTQTGLAIGFDQWQSGALNGGTYWDVPGISVRVDGQLLAQFPMPLRPGNVYRPSDPLPTAGNLPYVDDTPCCGNGAVAPEMDVATNDVLYINSLQTGAQNTNEYNGTGVSVAGTQQPAYGDPDYDLWMTNLVWEHFKAELTDDGHVKITYKNQELTPPGGLATTFAPRPGRIVFAGRTGGSRSVMQVDNLRLVTQPFTSVAPLVFAGNAAGFTLQLQDQGSTTLDANSVTLTNNGVALASSSVTLTKIGAVTYVHYTASPLLAVGSTNIVGFGYKDNFGITSTGTRTLIVGPYSTIPAAYATTGAVTSGSGFNVFVHQLPVSRGPGDPNTVANAERQLANGFIDPSTGQPYVNQAPAGTGPGGTYPLTVINWNIDPTSDGTGADIGNFRDTNSFPQDVADDAIPGITPGPDPANSPDLTKEWIVVRTVAYLDLPAGFYTLGVNSDDGFKVAVAPAGPDVLGLTLANQNTGRGSTDTLFDVNVPTAGVYPVTLEWWQGNGGANCEFFYVDQVTGQKILINDRRAGITAPIKAYPTATTTRPYVAQVSPEKNQLFVFADTDVSADVADGTIPVNNGSVQLFLNGTQVGTAAKNGNVTTVSRPGSISNLLPAGVNNLTLLYSFTDGGNTVNVTNTSTFSVVPYAVIPAANAVPSGQVDQTTAGFKATVIQIDRSGDTNQANGGRLPTGDQNLMPRPEIELANGNINPTNGLPYPNLADLSATNEPGIFNITDVINWNLNGTAVPAASGIFNGGDNFQDADNPLDTALPGLPGRGTSNAGLDNSVHELRTYLSLKAGAYVMAFNSDDGFTAVSALDPHDTLGTLLGYANVGRGNANPLPAPAAPSNFIPTPGTAQNNFAFGVVVPQDGFYPFRILYWEGGGGVNAEFLSVDKGSGQQALVNDTAVPWAIKAYRNYTGLARPWVKFSVSPTPWDNRIQQSGPGPILAVGRTVNSATSGDIANSANTTRPWADSVGAIVANGVGDPTLRLLINGTPVAANLTTNGSDITIRYKTPLPSGSTNRASLVYGGTTNSWSFIVQTYTNLNASDAQPLSSAAGGTRGFRVKMTQVASTTGYTQNSVARAEAQLAGILAPDISMPGPGPNGTYIYPGIINWNNNVNPNRSGVQIGNFQRDVYGAWPWGNHPDDPVPGVPNTTTNPANNNTDNIAAEVFAWLEFDNPGYYRFGVNSDDGYAVKVGAPGVTNGTVVASFDIGKGSSDIPFSVNVPQAGLYPIRLVYYNGGGGANLEYFSYDDTGNKIPINDTNNAAAIKAFYNISAGPQLKFASVTVSGGQVHLNVTVPTGTATLEQASVLTGSPSDWSTAQSGVTGTTTIDLPAATSGNKFYRLKQ